MRREDSNPLFGPNKLKLGVFFGNIGGGARPTTAAGRLRAEWGDVLSMAQMADRGGFEALVPLALWGGWGGPSRFGIDSFETATWAAALSQATRSISVFSTTQVATYNPVMAAKLAATIDHISGGRFAMNIVCGHSRDDLDLFGAPALEHDAWYDYATEWLEVLHLLWEKQERFDYKGKYFDLRGAQSHPKPLQQPFPALMNAGTSEVGQRWAAQHADMAFTAVPAGDYQAATERVARSCAALSDDVNRSIGVWLCASVVVRSSVEEAEDYVNQVFVDEADMEAVSLLARDPELPHRIEAMPDVEARQMRRQLVGTSFFQQPLWGTPEWIVEQLRELSRIGVDGVLLTFVDYHYEIRRWINEVMPRLVAAGLRR